MPFRSYNLGPILLRGLSLHNLKSIDLDLPSGSFVVISGPSGAGKSSLALDTIYAEAQRRYIETFSPYARQFLERLPRPPARSIGNLPAAVAISQANPVRSARSTVGTLAEITYPARHLFFRRATLFCPECGRTVHDQQPQEVASLLVRKREEGQEGVVFLTASVPPDRVPELAQAGYFRGLVAGKVEELSPGGWGKGADVEILVDRFPLSALDPVRVADSAEQAYGIGNGRLSVHLPGGEVIRASRGRHCPVCDRSFPAPNPNLFSFNSPIGACPGCKGFGRVMAIDWDLVIPDHALSLEEGAIRPMEHWEDEVSRLLDWCRRAGIPTDIPWGELSKEARRKILFGHGAWDGVQAIFDYLETKRYKAHIRILLSRYRAYLTCPDCNGSRFRPETGWYRLRGLRIFDFYALNLEKALSWAREVSAEVSSDPASRQLVEDLERRLVTLVGAGLGYLRLDRQSRTLSGGEVARVAIARAIGTELSETLYVLDEPTAGLHSADTARILGLMEGLRSRGNTVIAVEHDPAVIAAADLEVGMGPGSGDRGGEIVYLGPPKETAGDDYPAPPEPAGKIPPAPERASIFLTGVRANNLKALTVSFPVGGMTVITGVSGSGKSTLLDMVLHRAALRAMGIPTESPGSYARLEGMEHVTGVHFVDQNPIGRTPRACPASYLHVLDGIRKVFAGTEEAGFLGLTPGDFSFNSPAGRCEACKGQGSEVVEMQFLPDITLPCPVCKGTRFRQEVLAARVGGRTIHDVLGMSLDEAFLFFGGQPGITRPLGPALELGLGHLRLGQPVNTLSGGESQRLKLARFLGRGVVKGALFLVDEPSRGLHPKEVRRVLAALAGIPAAGGTVIAVEHDLSMIRAADWVIDLGPGGGDLGGEVVYEGPPGGLLSCRRSLTGAALCGERPERAGHAAPSFAGPEGEIRITGARHHNLKNIDVSIPKGRFVVITGLSGSGKSSLAFDIVFAEGQRRYIEGLSSYMRQFIRLHERPDVDRISGLTPTVAIEQRTSRSGPRSTVATLTETAHYLRLLYARAAHPVCSSCGGPMRTADEAELARELAAILKRPGAALLAPRVRRRKGWHQPDLEAAFRAGVGRVRIDGKFRPIPPIPSLSRYGEHTIEWVIEPRGPGEDLSFLVKRALGVGKGELILLDGQGGESFFSTHYFCPSCRIGLPEADPLLFSFNTRAGACEECDGAGVLHDQNVPCPSCLGTRMNAEARAWRIGGLGIHEISALEVDEAETLLRGWKGKPPWSSRLAPVATPLLDAVLERLGFLVEVGLGYLPLDRAGDTLSGGEAQRIRLAAQIGSGLTGLTIVLDEPTIGLHPRDNGRLLAALTRLKSGGNTVVVVEHDEATIRAADWIIDLGPGGGREGGQVVAKGTPAEILGNPESATGKALSDVALRRLAPTGRSPSSWLSFSGISSHNLSGLDVSIPLGCLVCVTGVSGSGKSTLVSGVIAPNMEALLLDRTSRPLLCARVAGHEAVSRLSVVDHSPIGRTPRSCPATYVGFMDEIRAIFARLPAARGLGYAPSRFSFNVEGGRCPACKGQGSRKVSLGFLPDVYVMCEECQGRRYESGTLEVRWHGKSMADVLAMTVDEARELFAHVPSLFRTLSLLSGLGIGYLTLGQPSPTLSGGEAQRLKIARELVNPGRGMTLYLLDEPTTGLHCLDVARLLEHLQRLVQGGNSVIVIEHNLDVMKAADWIVDLGPEGGRRGGRVLFSGPVEEFLRSGVKSATRDALVSTPG